MKPGRRNIGGVYRKRGNIDPIGTGARRNDRRVAPERADAFGRLDLAAIGPMDAVIEGIGPAEQAGAGENDAIGIRVGNFAVRRVVVKGDDINALAP